MTFAVSFLSGALIVFGLVGAIGMMFVTAGVPRPWRAGIAGAGLVTLAVMDLVTIQRKAYCPIGWRRQTPRVLLRRHPVRTVAALWGFDTGLGVTTIRVAAITWGALLLAALGLSPLWAGVGYAVGFIGPFLLLLWRHRVGRASRATAPTDPGLESLLAQRPLLQAMSAMLLTGAGTILIGSAIA